MNKLSLCASLMAVVLCGCGPKAMDSQSFEKLTGEFVESTLALAPVAATSAGLHEHAGQKLDTLLDDYSAAGVERQRKHYSGWKAKLASVDRKSLDAQAQADLDLMAGTAEAALLELDTLQGWRHNPTVYVELIGNGIFTPFSVEYAPVAERWSHIIARLRAVPALLDAAKQQLAGSNAIWTRVAIEEGEGNLALVEKVFPEKVPAAQKAEYESAAGTAAAAMRAFHTHLKGLKDEGPEAWRLGKEKYAAKFKLTVGSDVTPEQLLADAEAELKAIRKQMFIDSLPLHSKYYPTHRDPVDLNLIVRETLDRVAAKHVAADAYFPEAERTLAETREFLKAHEDRIVKMPGRDNLKLIETPEFMRGIYGVGGFSPAPALQPELGAFYWLTPIPKDWPKERVESKLREYNDYGLRILTIHEAIPGHYVQFEYANAIEPKPRRVLRSLFGSGPYMEGWATYATDVMLKEGYLQKSPELSLTFQKQMLRAIANTILDIRLHTGNMTEAEAMSLMVNQTFQEKEEATAKYQRARLGACQLPTYFAGYRAWKALRAAAEQKDGAKFNPGEFHRRALEAGALPMPVLTRLLGLPAKGESPSK